jgi:hypothetical protein
LKLGELLKPHFGHIKLGELLKPHFGHIISNLPPHSTQNLAVSGFSSWHFGHFTFDAPRERTKKPHQDNLIHPNEGLILTLNPYAFPQLKRLEARKMGNATSWYQFISQEIGACQALLFSKGKHNILWWVDGRKN